jgi:hypothetical protein
LKGAEVCAVDDVTWLLSQEIFGGHKFESFEDSEHFDMSSCAAVVRAVIEREDFCNAIVVAVTIEREILERSVKQEISGWLDLPSGDKQKMSRKLLSASYGISARMQYAGWSGARRSARLVESVVRDGLWAKSCFADIPKRSPRQHRDHYGRITNLARQLADEMDGELKLSSCLSEDPLLYGPVPFSAILRDLARFATEEAAEPPLARPNAKHAERTFVAKSISEHLRWITGGYRHAAAASLLNVLFPDAEPVDSVYMQSISRTIVDPFDDIDEEAIRQRAIQSREAYDKGLVGGLEGQ